MTEGYESFIAAKTHAAPPPRASDMEAPPALYDWQRELVAWALARGRAAIFADCGLGKTPMQLTWSANVVRRTNRPVLVLTPLAVAQQTVREGEKFGIEVRRPPLDGAGVYVANYQRLHHFDPADFGGVVCDESSILKNFDGATKASVTAFLRAVPYRLLCTATAAPNDFYEFGTSSEALGELGFMDMLAKFFVNNRNNAALNPMGHQGGPTWRFKGHAELPFWRWVCSWARALRRPSDVGGDDGPFLLPQLDERRHVVEATSARDGMLFAVPAVGFAEEREERRRTIRERCERAAELATEETGPVVLWAGLNDEADLLERLIPGAVQVSGRDSDETKEEKFLAFQDGSVRALVTKPVIGAWGLNWQHCSRTIMFATHSFEQYYQAIRRFWRFGQTRIVRVDHVLSDGQGRVLRNLQRKQEQADRMFDNLVENVGAAMRVSRPHARAEVEVPQWLT